MLWFKKKVHHKNYTPIKIKTRLSRRTLAIRAVAVFVLGVWAAYTFLMPKGTEAAWKDPNWRFRKKITVDHNKVSGNADLSNYPLLISMRDYDLKKGALSTGYDIMFTSSDGTTKLDHEIEKYTSTTGDLVVWVRLPTFADATDTVIYMYYGNPSATNQQNRTGVWDSNYQGVWHLDETTGNRIDSTANANDTSDTGGVAGTNGPVDGANTFDNSSTAHYLSRSGASSVGLSPTGNMTVEVWFKKSSYSTSEVAVSKDGSSSGNSGWSIRNTTGAKAQWQVSNDGTTIVSANGTTTLSTNTWYHIVGVYDGSNITVYVNGVSDKVTAHTAGIFASSANFNIGARVTNSNLWNGDIDEVRVSNTNRSPDWIATTYANEANPSTFYTISGQEQGPLELYWRLDEGRGTTAYDATGNNLDGTITGATWQTEESCLFGRCLKFNGSSDKVVGTYNANLDVGTSDFAVSTWFKHPTAISSTQVLISRYSGAGYKVYMNSSGQMCFGIDNDSTWGPNDSACSTTAYNDNKWHQVKATKTGTANITLYIDGVQVAQNTSLTSNTSLSGSSPTVIAGIDSDGSSNAWNGFLDDIKLYVHARSSAQIGTDYNAKGSVNGVSTTFGTVGANQSLSNGLIEYLKMDETTANSCAGGVNDNCDASGNANNGAWTGNATVISPGKFGSAVTFDGTGDYITVTDSSSLSPTSLISFGAWVYPSTSIATKAILVKNNAFRLVTDASGNPICQIYSSGSWQSAATSSTALSLSSWQHVACTYDQEKLKVYVNGEEKGSSSVTTSINDSTDAFEVGRDGGGTYGDYNGYIDEARVYNRFLTATEIVSLKEWSAGPVLYYKFDERTGTTAFDLSGYGNNGTLTSGPTWSAGKQGAALSFDGTDDVVNAGNSSTLNDMPAISAGLWVYPRSTPGTSARIISKQGTSNANGWKLLQNNGDNHILFITDFVSTDLSVETSTALPLNTWTYVEVSWDGSSSASNVHIYMNGVEGAYATQTSAVGNRVSDASISLGIGNRLPTTTGPFDGLIDEVKIYNYSRTAKQATEDLNSAKPFDSGVVAGTPIGYWKMDEGYSTTIRNSGSYGSSLDMTLSGSPAWATAAKKNKAVDFDGSNDLASINDTSNVEPTGDMTISAWFKLDTLPSVKGEVEKIMFKRHSVSPFVAYELMVGTDNLIKFEWVNTTPTYYLVSSNSTVTAGTWYHVVAVKENNTLKLYVNGQLQTSTTTTTGTLYNSDGTLSIGAASSGSERFDGIIDEVKLYEVALNADQAKTEYNQGSATVVGALSTESDGVTASFNQNRAYCLPGDTGTCNPPVGEWKFDERTGTTANDTSGNGLTGTLGGTPYWSNGKIGPAILFDGSDDDVTVNDNTLLKPTAAMTIELWINSSNISASNKMIISKRESGGYRVAIKAGNCANAICFLTIIGGTEYDATYSISNLANNTWYHVVGQYDGSAVKLYINGVMVSSVPATGTMQNGTQPFCIGGEANAADCGTSNFGGIIDNVEFFNYARSDAQIAWDYNRGLPTHWYKFDECTGSTAYNSGGNGSNATITIGGSNTQTSTGNCNSGTSSEMWYNGTNGKYYSALNLDGDDYAELTGLANSPANISLAAWVNLTTADSSGSEVISIGDYVTLRADAPSNGVTGIFYDGTSWHGVSSSVNIAGTGWHHLAYTFDKANSSQKIYIDGNLMATTSDTQAIVYTGAGSNTEIGRHATGSTTNDFTGKIDDARIYNYPLTRSQILNIMNENAALRFGPVTGQPINPR